MTDKQIIIDGVDVSGCSDISGHVNDFGEYECLCRCIFGDGSDDYGVIGHEMCKDNPNCHYKNWQRKEQECEKAKQNAQDTYDLWQALIESFNILQGEKIKLEQECEELKAELELFKTSNQTTIDQLKKENDALFKAIEEVNQINKRLESENEELTSKCSQLRDELNFHIHNMNKQNEALHNENKELKKENEKLKEEVTALNIAYDDLMEVI